MASVTPISSGGVNGIGGLIAGGNPGYNAPTVDQGTNALIAQQAAQAQNYTPGDYAGRDIAGTTGTADNTGVQNFHAALGGASDPNMQAALQARSQRYMDSGLNQLQRQAMVMGVNQQSTQSQNAMSAAIAGQNAQNMANQAQVQAFQNNQASRNSVINTLFGGAATIGAMSAAGSFSGGGGSANTTMADGSVAGSSNNFGAGQMSQPEMGGQFGGGAPSLSGGGY